MPIARHILHVACTCLPIRIWLRKGPAYDVVTDGDSKSFVGCTGIRFMPRADAVRVWGERKRKLPFQERTGRAFTVSIAGVHCSLIVQNLSVVI